jgi:hypothetical protein
MGLFPSARWRVGFLLGGGLLALLVAYLLVTVPADAPSAIGGPVETVREPLVDLVEDLGREPVTWGLALVGGAYALVRLGNGRDRPAVSPTFAATESDSDGTGAPTVDDELRRDLQRVTRWIDDPRYGGEELRSRVRRSAVETVRTAGGTTEREAERAVERGTWTDDRIAAAFVGGKEAPGYPFRNRVRGWLRPDLAFERRFERTVDAVYDYGREER